jgi:V-type H+-transporting ATPase subunit C
MGFFLIGTPLIENSKPATIKEIREIVSKKGVGDGAELNIERDRFKMGNLDTLMFMNDKLIKLESNVESLLKKIDRQFLDLNDQVGHKWEIKCADGLVALDKFISRFKWNDSRFPRSHPLNKLVEMFEGKLNSYESELRIKSNAFNETKTTLTQTQQKEYREFYSGVTTMLRTSQILLLSHMSATATSSTPNTSLLSSLLCLYRKSSTLKMPMNC